MDCVLEEATEELELVYEWKAAVDLVLEWKAARFNIGLFFNRLELKMFICDWFIKFFAHDHQNGAIFEILIGVIFIGFKLNAIHFIGP